MNKITKALTDSVFTTAFLDGIMNHTGPVYPYYFDYPGKHEVLDWMGSENIWFGAAHVAESAFIWRNPNAKLSEGEMTLSKNLIKMVTNFIKYRFTFTYKDTVGAEKEKKTVYNQ